MMLQRCKVLVPVEKMCVSESEFAEGPEAQQKRFYFHSYNVFLVASEEPFLLMKRL